MCNRSDRAMGLDSILMIKLMDFDSYFVVLWVIKTQTHLDSYAGLQLLLKELLKLIHRNIQMFFWEQD